MMILDDKDNAYLVFQKFIQSKHRGWYQKILMNSSRHALFKPEDEADPYYYVVFKREFFMTFHTQFPKFYKANSDYSYVGESINKDFLELAIRKDVHRLVFFYSDGRAYYTSPMIFKRFAEKHSLIRVQESGEKTYSIPLSVLQRLE